MKTDQPLGPLNILVVEDDKSLCDAIVDALAGAGHFVQQVDCAEGISELVNLVKLDIVILDVNLPDENGFSLAHRLRISDEEIGIIIVSGETDTKSRATGYENGADIYLPKPIELHDLLIATESLGKRIKKTIISRMKIIRLDMNDQAVSCHDKKVKLSSSEALLLAEFLTAPQNILYHEQIKSILNLSDKLDIKPIIELKISRLRKKISTIEKTVNPMRSVYGKGYQLCVKMTT